MKKFIAVVVSAVVLALSNYGCLPIEPSEAVRQDRIFTTYDLFYDANRDVTVARAAFHFGNEIGTQLELSDSSYIKCNNRDLTKTSFVGYVYYEATFQGYVQSGTFVYSNNNSETFTNTVTIHPIQFASSIPTISRSASYQMGWSGDAVQSNEEVHLLLWRTNDIELAHAMQNAQGSTSLLVDMNKIQSIPSGAIKMALERKLFNRSLAQAPAAGGYSVGRYFPLTKDNQIVE